MAENFDIHRSSTIDKRKRIDRGLEAIAFFKLAKGVLLVIVGAGAAKLVHADVYEFALGWVAALHADPDNRYVHWLLEKLMSVDERTLRHLSVGTFVYAALVCTEGIGLLCQQTWAEYLTVIATASFIPLELFELSKHFSAVKLGVLGINLAVVWYLINMLRENTSRHRVQS